MGLPPRVSYIRLYSALANGVAMPSAALQRESGVALYTPESSPSTNPFQPIFFKYGNFRYDHGSTRSATYSRYCEQSYLACSLPPAVSYTHLRAHETVLD